MAVRPDWAFGRRRGGWRRDLRRSVAPCAGEAAQVTDGGPDGGSEGLERSQRVDGSGWRKPHLAVLLQSIEEPMAWRQRPTRLPAPFLKRVAIDPERVESWDAYPFNLPLFSGRAFELSFERPVTIIVGENGVGKS